MNQSTTYLVQWSPKHAIYNMQGEWASRDSTLFSSIHSLTTQSGSREGIQECSVQRKTHGKYSKQNTSRKSQGFTNKVVQQSLEK